MYHLRFGASNVSDSRKIMPSLSKTGIVGEIDSITMSAPTPG
jgi:hypothetical protein